VKKSPWGPSALGAFLLAAAGQACLAQAGLAWTLGPGILFYALGFLLLRRAWASPTQPLAPITPRTEWISFLLILGVALAFRLPLPGYPAGVFADRAEVALGAQRILSGGWWPGLELLSHHVPEIPIYYLVAGWFALFGASPQAFAYFDMALSLLGLVAVYFFLRETAGARAALWAFFLLAVMRWNFAFAHQIYFQAQSPLLVGLALGAFYAALRKDSAWRAALAGALGAAGLYAYQAGKALPILLLACAGFEFLRDAKGFRKRAPLYGAMAAAFVLLAVPYFYRVACTGELGRRDAEVSVLRALEAQKSPAPLAVNFAKQALMFNRQADNNTQADFNRHRMLDDGTGILFVLGFFYALTRLRERPFFLAAAGVCVMSLPSLLSVDAGHAGRSLGATPFVALSAALLLERLASHWRAANPKGPWAWAAPVGLGLFLTFIVFENAWDYYGVQVKNPACQNDCSWTESRVGEIIGRSDASTDFFLPSRFYGHPTVQYLAGTKAGQSHPLDPAHLPQPIRGHAFCFLLDDAKAGILAYLEKEYPGGQAQSLADPLGEVSLLGYRIGAPALDRLAPASLGLKRGLWGVYAHSEDPNEKPFLTRWDPLVNFSFRDLPDVGTPLFIHWRGSLEAPGAGDYSLGVLTEGLGKAKLLVDGMGPAAFDSNPQVRARLSPGAHRLDLYFKQAPTPLAPLHLLWLKPGAAQFEVVPNEAFGKVTE